MMKTFYNSVLPLFLTASASLGNAPKPALNSHTRTPEVSKSTPANETLALRMRAREGFFDTRHIYLETLLRLALEETLDEGPYRIDLIDTRDTINKARSFELLAAGNNIDIEPSMTSQQLEERFEPVRVCLRLGLIGWRLFIERSTDAERLQNVKKIEDLKSHVIGSGTVWPDSDIMEKAGLKVFRFGEYRPLFQMLSSLRFDLLTRALYEPFDEVKAYGNGKLMVDPYVVLRFPAADYFFLRKGNRKTASRIERGLFKALSNGKFLGAFQEAYGWALEEAQLQSRTIIDIPNPLLPSRPPIGVTAWSQWKSRTEGLLKQTTSLLPKTPRPPAKRVVVRLMSPGIKPDARLVYHASLIELALGHTREMGDYQVKVVLLPGVEQSEALSLLQKNKTIDTYASVVTAERAKNLTYIPLPLTLGLIGQRLLVVNSAKMPLGAEPSSEAEVQKLRICVGTDWPDRRILENAGYKTIPRPSLPSLYRALNLGQCDALTRAVFEVDRELKNQGNPRFRVLPKWRMSYPMGEVFFFNPSNKALQERLEEGFRRALWDGSLLQTLRLHFGESLNKFGLLEREALILKNPDVPADLPLTDERTWNYLID
jgi:hypothetical protein